MNTNKTFKEEVELVKETYTANEVDDKLDELVKEILKQIDDAWEKIKEHPADEFTSLLYSFKDEVVNRITNLKI